MKQNFQSRPLNAVSCVPFSRKSFCDQVLAGSNATHGSTNTQTEYLAGYLFELKAQTLVIEQHYIDRHFIEEHSLYYSRCLNPRTNACIRIHAFSNQFDDKHLDKWLHRAANGESQQVELDLEKQYLGFVVVRPLPSVPIGRTVLVHFGDKPTRHFPPIVDYDVHFLGLELTVRGLAFQQQDRAVAACATTSIWTALNSVGRRDGMRVPTPSTITESAVRFFTPFGRAFPSHGLSVEQICEGIRGTGFAPEIFKVSGKPDLFSTFLHSYVRSRIPVILAIQNSLGGHAVTVVGYRQSPSPSIPLNGESLARRNLGFDQIYIHDDRLGPYARAKLKKIKSKTRQELELSITLPSGQTEISRVLQAVAPLYPKLRGSANELYQAAHQFFPVIQKLTKKPNEELGLEFFFERSGTYLRSLFDLGVQSARLIPFLKSIALSRYVGVVRWYLDDIPIVDMVWDTTDTLREESKWDEHLLATIALDSRFTSEIDSLGKLIGCQTA